MDSKIQSSTENVATVNQMFGGSFKLLTTAEHCFVVWTELTDLIAARPIVVGGWEKPPNVGCIYGPQHLSVELWMLLKGAVIARAFMGLLIYFDWENYEPARINLHSIEN